MRFHSIIRPTILPAACVAIACLTAGCGRGASSDASNASPPRSERIVMTGSSTVAPVAAEIARRYEEAHPNVRIDVQTGGSGRGIADAQSGTAQIGMASRALESAEAATLVTHTIARDGIGLIINAANDQIDGLSRDEVIAIYRGDIENWSELGGPDLPIVVVNKAEGRATLELFLKHFGLKNTEIEEDIVVGDNEQGIKTVAGNAAAIGYVSIGAAAYSAEAGVQIRVVSFDGIQPTLENVRNGTFPIVRPLNLLTNGEPDGVVADFIDYARSDQVHDIVKSLFFVPIGE